MSLDQSVGPYVDADVQHQVRMRVWTGRAVSSERLQVLTVSDRFGWDTGQKYARLSSPAVRRSKCGPPASLRYALHKAWHANQVHRYVCKFNPLPPFLSLRSPAPPSPAGLSPPRLHRNNYVTLA